MFINIFCSRHNIFVPVVLDIEMAIRFWRVATSFVKVLFELVDFCLVFPNLEESGACRFDLLSL